jgi:Sulfotransferase domain
MKVFGIGLGRTGTKSLTVALNKLDIKVIHYPNDSQTLQELMAGNYNFSILQQYDGIADITVAPFYAQLDQLFPESKFILTVRDKESWLKSIEKHWQNKPVFDDSPNQSEKMELRRLLRASAYGLYTFNRDRLSYVYDLHYRNVLEYFKNRPDSLLVFNLCGGESWEKLCPFLGQQILDEAFPTMNKKSLLSHIMSANTGLISCSPSLLMGEGAGG